MKNVYLILCLAGLFGISSLQAQPLSKPSTEQSLIAARMSIANRDYVNALEYYQQAYETTQDPLLIDTIAQMYLAVRDYRTAERWFSRLLRRDKEGDYEHYRFTYGRLLKMNEKYDEAVEELQKFLATNPGDSLATLAKNELSGAELAQELPLNLKGVEVDNAGRTLNTKTSLYTPALVDGGKHLYFAAFEDAEDVIYIEEDSEDPDFYALIHQSTRDDNDWSKPEPLDETINRPGFHNINVAFSDDGRTMFFTRAKMQGNTLKEGKIYYSVGGSGSWQGAEEVEGINGDYIAKHPMPGELFGQKVLFFVSDMEGGYGGFDLYYSIRLGEGKYGRPVNLGSVVNTPGDEDTPYYRDGTLYFASTGHPGLGGFDIFYATWDGEVWSQPLNIGRGYNTSVDDYAFTLDDEGYFGMLTSNRVGSGGRSAYGRTCCDNLYTVTIAKMVIDIVVGTFTEEKKPLTGSTVYLVPMTNDKMGEPNAQDSGEKSNVVGFDLAPEIMYMMIGTHPDYYPDTVRLNTQGITESTSLQHRFYLKSKPPPPPPPPAYDTVSTEQAIVLENILYDFDDDRIRQEAESDLTYIVELMNDYPDMKIELSSHTDNRGNAGYNEGLSQRRAESARRWLMRNGVKGERVVAKGYGMNQPKTVNDRSAAANDFLNEGDVLDKAFIDALATEEQRERAHELNRRTEFKILEGPKTIVIQTVRLRKKEETKPSKDRGSLPGASQAAGKPELKFIREEVNFGKVKKGDTASYTYVFYNSGDAPFTIDLISACDCTKVVDDPTGRTFKPGDKGTLGIVFDSSEKEESETIDIDIFLRENDERGAPIMKTVKYSFELIK